MKTLELHRIIVTLILMSLEEEHVQYYGFYTQEIIYTRAYQSCFRGWITPAQYQEITGEAYIG